MGTLSEAEKKDFDMQVRLASQDDKDFWIETLFNAATEDDIKHYENLLAKRKGELGVSSGTAVTSTASRKGFKGSRKERHDEVFSWLSEHIESDGTLTPANRSTFREKFACADSTVNRWLKEYRRSTDSERSDSISSPQKDDLSSSIGKPQEDGFYKNEAASEIPSECPVRPFQDRINKLEFTLSSMCEMERSVSENMQVIHLLRKYADKIEKEL